MSAFAFALDSDPLRCPRCLGAGLVAIPEPDGRRLPWGRDAICTECHDGTVPCGACGEFAATHLDDHGQPIGDCCDPVMVGLELTSAAAPAGVTTPQPYHRPASEPLPESAESGRRNRISAGAAR